MKKLVIILGPTGAGKSNISQYIAEKYPFEIVSADSMQIYKHLDIGTDKPPKEIQNKIPHHLINIVNPDEDFNAKNYQKLGDGAVNLIFNNNKLPLIVGGTGFYIKALEQGLFEIENFDKELIKTTREEIENLIAGKGKDHLFQYVSKIDPESTQKIKPNDIYRLSRVLEVYKLTGKKISELQKQHGFNEKRYETLKIGLYPSRMLLYKNINNRVDNMLKTGLLDEIKNVFSMGYSKDLKPLQTFGYKFFIQYLSDEIDLEKATYLTKMETRHFAKRQFTWFKKDKEIIWENDENKICEKIKKFLNI